MRVEILDYTRNWQEIIKEAIATSDKKLSDETIDNLLDLVIENDYCSVLEHIFVTIKIKGVSIALSRELLEHRIGVSHTGRSTRYNEETEFRYYVPKELPSWAYNKFLRLMERIQKLYEEMISNGIPKEKARYILPLAAHTEYVLTMNMRSLRHFLSLRLCARASPEIRELAEMIKKEVSAIFPFVKKFGCRGENMGVCPENEVRPSSCQKRIPLSKDIKRRSLIWNRLSGE